jgi:hypothetical protein
MELIKNNKSEVFNWIFYDFNIDYEKVRFISDKIMFGRIRIAHHKYAELIDNFTSCKWTYSGKEQLSLIIFMSGYMMNC